MEEETSVVSDCNHLKVSLEVDMMAVLALCLEEETVAGAEGGAVVQA